MSQPFRSIAVLGTGLIGSSLALAIRADSPNARIMGFDLNADSRRGAGGLKTPSGAKAFDQVSGNMAQALNGAELVILSAPVRSLELLLREVGTLAAPGTVVADTGSTKQQVLAWAEEHLPQEVAFV